MEVINYYLCEAAIENQEGALNLAKGNVAYALELFQSAFDILDKLRQLPQMSKVGLPRIYHYSSVSVPFIQNERVYSYSRAMMFSPTVSEFCLVNEIAFYSGVVLFNMAIAHQMTGHALKDEASFKTSVSLYAACYTSVSTLPQCLPDVDLLRVAALNNKAMVLTNLLEYKQARQTMDEIRDKWRHALVLHYASEAFVREDIEGFILNTMEALPPTAAACA